MSPSLPVLPLKPEASVNLDLLDRLLASSSILALVEVGPDRRVARVNPAFASYADSDGEGLAGRPVAELLTAADAERVAGWLEDDDVPTDAVRLNFLAAGGSPFTLRCLVDVRAGVSRILGEPEAAGDRTVAEELMRLNNELATLARERARRERELERTRRDLEATLEELRTSYWHLQKIQEVLPLCMRCGMVKTDEAHWQSVVDYLKDNAIFLSHGYCPGCARIVMKEFGLEEEED